ncbi:MAG: hypothetical protein ACFKPT_09895 [Gloeotrichia echinulata GP01]
MTTSTILMKVNLILIHYRTIQPMRSNLKRQVFAGLTRTFIDIRERIYPTPEGHNTLKIFWIFRVLLVGFLL